MFAKHFSFYSLSCGCHRFLTIVSDSESDCDKEYALAQHDPCPKCCEAESVYVANHSKSRATIAKPTVEGVKVN